MNQAHILCLTQTELRLRVSLTELARDPDCSATAGACIRKYQTIKCTSIAEHEAR